MTSDFVGAFVESRRSLLLNEGRIMELQKTKIGRLLGAGEIGSIFCLKVIETGVIPATIHLSHEDHECDLDYVPNGPHFQKSVHTLLNVNYGFGGTNSALMFRRAQ